MLGSPALLQPRPGERGRRWGVPCSGRRVGAGRARGRPWGTAPGPGVWVPSPCLLPWTRGPRSDHRVSSAFTSRSKTARRTCPCWSWSRWRRPRRGWPRGCWVSFGAPWGRRAVGRRDPPPGAARRPLPQAGSSGRGWGQPGPWGAPPTRPPLVRTRRVGVGGPRPCPPLPRGSACVVPREPGEAVQSDGPELPGASGLRVQGPEVVRRGRREAGPPAAAPAAGAHPVARWVCRGRGVPQAPLVPLPPLGHVLRPGTPPSPGWGLGLGGVLPSMPPSGPCHPAGLSPLRPAPGGGARVPVLVLPPARRPGLPCGC